VHETNGQRGQILFYLALNPDTTASRQDKIVEQQIQMSAEAVGMVLRERTCAIPGRATAGIARVHSF
jgi:hypothetical protein